MGTVFFRDFYLFFLFEYLSLHVQYISVCCVFSLPAMFCCYMCVEVGSFHIFYPCKKSWVVMYISSYIWLAEEFHYLFINIFSCSTDLMYRFSDCSHSSVFKIMHRFSRNTGLYWCTFCGKSVVVVLILWPYLPVPSVARAAEKPGISTCLWRICPRSPAQ